MYLDEEFLHKFTATQVVPGDVNPKDIMNKKKFSLDKQNFSHSLRIQLKLNTTLLSTVRVSVRVSQA